jgi:hypothetical protein
MSSLLRVLPIMAIVATTTALPASADDGDPRVYLRLTEGMPAAVDEVADRLVAALVEADWNVVAEFPCGVPEDKCSFGARVIVAYTDAHRDRLLAYGNHAAYALPTRFVVYEDEFGAGIGATNPMNLFRTIVDEDTEPEAWSDMAEEIRAVTASAFPEHAIIREYGQDRGKARIGRTFGIMAGGPFVEKFKNVVTEDAAGRSALEIAEQIAEGLPGVEGDWEWGIRPVYLIDLPQNDMALVGVTGLHMEARSFDIVKHGGDGARDDLACPGLDHAAAYPISVAVQIVDGELKVELVDVMFRMKMYFENAGKMAFAKNMGMPGSIEDEIKDKIRAVLQP